MYTRLNFNAVKLHFSPQCGGADAHLFGCKGSVPIAQLKGFYDRFPDPVPAAVSGRRIRTASVMYWMKTEIKSPRQHLLLAQRV